MQETEELFAEFQISLKILEKLSERNIELMDEKAYNVDIKIYRRIY